MKIAQFFRLLRNVFPVVLRRERELCMIRLGSISNKRNSSYTDGCAAVDMSALALNSGGLYTVLRSQSRAAGGVESEVAAARGRGRGKKKSIRAKERRILHGGVVLCWIHRYHSVHTCYFARACRCVPCSRRSAFAMLCASRPQPRLSAMTSKASCLVEKRKILCLPKARDH